MRIGFVGAGRMGRPVIDRLVAAGHRPRVLARKEKSRAELETAGLDCGSTVADTTCDADLVFCMVLDDGQVRAALLGCEGAIASMPQGSVLVLHTTCDPSTVAELVDAGDRRGVRVLDAAVSGNPRDIAEGALTLWVGGDEGTLAEVRPVLAAYASPVLHVGPPGHGQLVKLVNQGLFVAQVGLAVEAVRLAGRLGIPGAEALAALQHGSGSSRALASVAWIGVDAVGERLAELMLKDVEVVREVAARHAIDLGLFAEIFDAPAVRDDVLCDGRPPARSEIDHRRLTPGSMKEKA